MYIYKYVEKAKGLYTTYVYIYVDRATRRSSSSGDKKMAIPTEVAKKVIEKIGVKEEKFSHTYHSQKAKVWEQYGKRRLYIPRNAYEQAGYVDLDTEKIIPTRPGNYEYLESALQMCKEMMSQ